MLIRPLKTRFNQCLSSIGWFCVIALFSGCSTNVQVQASFPTPLVNSLPYTLAVHYPESFQQYSYEEQDDKRGSRTIGIGNAQIKLFDTMLLAMFDNVVKTEQPVAGTDADLLLTITVDEFQYTVPKETKIDMYEVWIKYNLQLFDSNDQLIADWLLSAYGKAPLEMMQTESNALNQAMIVALRDAGASFSLKFSKVPEVRRWLAQHKRDI